MTVSFLVTRRELALGAQDAVTGWYAPTFTDTADYDKMFLAKKGQSLAQFGVGSYARYDKTGIICAPVFEGDQTIVNSKYYDIATVDAIEVGDSHIAYECELHLVSPHWDPPSYGTGAAVNDPRYQAKLLLDTYLPAQSLKKIGGVDNASYITCWADAPYPLKRVFETKAVDLVFSIGMGEQQSLVACDKVAYGYNEKVPIEVSAIHKTAIQGDNMVWQGVQALRNISRLYPIGSIRDLATAKMTTKQLGSFTLFSVQTTLNYTRGIA